MSRLTRVPEYVLEIDQNLIRDFMETPCSNRKQIQLACIALKQIIQNDLTPRQQEVIQLYYYQNFNNKQIAELLHIDASTVCRTLQRAKNKIYKLMHFYIDYLNTVTAE
ncbi:MAG: sigma-70 family RNA polymerase sigma factor [Oscillospiraceae bacterium]|nr:sigma-70 family RNA polymerase sigma factor [Oscillospiraceae bacterium]